MIKTSTEGRKQNQHMDTRKVAADQLEMEVTFSGNMPLVEVSQKPHQH